MGNPPVGDLTLWLKGCGPHDRTSTESSNRDFLRCSYQMRVGSKPQRRYTCTALAALAPAEFNLLEEVLATQRADGDREMELRADQLARAEYEAELAQRHYQAVDPANRLVAAELERRWEIALQAVVEADGRNARTNTRCWTVSSRTVGQGTLDACSAEGHVA